MVAHSRPLLLMAPLPIDRPERRHGDPVPQFIHASARKLTVSPIPSCVSYGATTIAPAPRSPSS